MKKNSYILFSLALIAILFIGAFTFYSNAATNTGATITPPNLDDGLVGHWTFDGSDMVSNVKDSSGNGNNGHLVGFTSTTSAELPGVIGQALKFNGVSQYVNIGSSPSLQNTSFSISTWISGNVSTGSGVIVGQGARTTDNGFELGLSGNTLICAFTGDGVGLFSSLLEKNANHGWHHITCVFDNSTKLFSVYLDTTLIATSTAKGTYIPTGDTNLYIGQKVLTAGFWNGSLDDVRVYNRALSAAEVAQLYSQGTASHQNVAATQPNLQTGLVGWWTFDGKNMINNITDSSGQGNNGKLVSFTSTTSAEVLGVMGQAISFNGSNQAIDTGNGSSLSNLGAGPLSLSLWAYINSSNSDEGLIGKTDNAGSNGWLLSYSPPSNSNNLSFSLYASNTNGRLTVSTPNLAKKWTHIVVVWNGSFPIGSSDVSVYFNGVKQSGILTTGSGTHNTAGSDHVFLGCLGDTVCKSKYFNGSLDDVRVYNRILSAAEIQQLYNQGIGTHQNVSITPTNLSSGLVGWWTFDGKNMITNVTDSSGQGNNGHLVGFTSTSTAVTPGVLGQALKFNGSSNYVNIGNTSSLQLTGSTGSWSAWVYATGSSNWPIIIAKQNSYNLHFGTGSGGKTPALYLATANNLWAAAVTASTPLSYNKWYLITATYDGINTKMYINGVLNNTSTTFTGNITTDNSSVSLGGPPNSTYFKGTLDDVRIYNRALSAAEVMQLYNLGH